MNIGILTYHWVSNFGAQLQTLSTYSFIEKSGHKPYIINWIPQDLENAYNKRVSAEQNMAHKQFCERYFPNITRLCRDTYDIASEIDRLEIDKVIIGSDAVFSYIPPLCRLYFGRKGVKYIKPLSVNEIPSPFWGDFYNITQRRIKLVALSASAQNTKYKRIFNQKQKNIFCKHLSNFDFISVRDVWTQNMLSFVTNNRIKPTITPDPVFGFQHNVKPNNENYIKHKFNISGKYVLITLNHNYVKKEWLAELEIKFANLGITLIGLPQTDKPYTLPLQYNITFPLDPLSWYNLIRESSGYIGELMHPVLVSLHNSVPVFSFDKYGFRKSHSLDVKSSKTYQIMQTFDLLDNYYNVLLSADFPSPDYVIERIVNFDKSSCTSHSIKMYDVYLEMMNNIITL